MMKREGSATIGRRKFIGLSGAMMICAKASAAESQAPLFSSIGMSGRMAHADDLKVSGAEFLTVNTKRFLMPDQPDDVFEKHLDAMKDSALPVLACNSFLSSQSFRCVGESADHEPILAWAECTFRRLKRAGGRFVVFGSGKCRRLPKGWPRAKAEAQFVALLKKLGPLAERHGVTVVVEQLREQECNFINRIAEAASVVRSTNHPNVRVLADFYHMACGGDGPDELRESMDLVAHTEVAEKEGRTYPGVHGQDFRPYFRVLRESGYRGAISIEGRGESKQLKVAFEEIRKQAAEV